MRTAKTHLKGYLIVRSGSRGRVAKIFQSKARTVSCAHRDTPQTVSSNAKMRHPHPLLSFTIPSWHSRPHLEQAQLGCSAHKQELGPVFSSYGSNPASLVPHIISAPKPHRAFNCYVVLTYPIEIITCQP